VELTKALTIGECSRDLTRAAMDGLVDPLVGRESELDRLIEILCRRTNDNAVLKRRTQRCPDRSEWNEADRSRTKKIQGCHQSWGALSPQADYLTASDSARGTRALIVLTDRRTH
jgi:hypothetical protein